MAGFRKFNTLVVSSLIRKFLLVRMSHDLIYLRKWLSIYHSGIVFLGMYNTSKLSLDVQIGNTS